MRWRAALDPRQEYSSNVPGAAARRGKSYFEAWFIQLRARPGANETVVAVAASILTAADQRPADVASRR
jgi:hypothetical protein